MATSNRKMLPLAAIGGKESGEGRSMPGILFCSDAGDEAFPKSLCRCGHLSH